MRILPLTAVAILALGCGSEPSSERTNVPANQSIDSAIVDRDATVAEDDSQGSFGIANTFSGQLSEEQERMVPEALRGAFTIESLRTIAAADLANELQRKTEVATESHAGKRYVALQDLRCVQFSDELSGQMIVIERYLIVDE